MTRILHRDGTVLFDCQASNQRDAVVEAVKSGANLSLAYLGRANLSGAYLSGAYLIGAYLSEANLGRANLGRANLSGANLIGAYLSEANLSGAYLGEANLGEANLSGADLGEANLSGAYLGEANLGEANLSGADLSGANLSGANLSGADLGGADLGRANLGRANLSGAKGFNPWITDGLRLLLDQPGPIRMYKLVTRDGYGPFSGGLQYVVGETVAVDEVNCDDAEHCGAGINLATFAWCASEWHPGYRILICEFTASDIAAIPHGTDGKFRVRRCTVVAEVDLVERGLVEKGQEAEAASAGEGRR